MQNDYNNNIKNSLNDIKVPDNISSYISKGVKKRRLQNGASAICKCLAALMIVTVTLGNLSPTLAKEIVKVPGVGSVFKYLHWNKSMAVLEELGLIKNVNMKCVNEGVEFIVNSYVSDDGGIVIYYETRSKDDYYVISKWKMYDEENKCSLGVIDIQDRGISKKIKDDMYIVKGYIKQSNDQGTGILFNLLHKIKLSVDLVAWDEREQGKLDNYIYVDKEMEYISQTHESYNVSYEWNVDIKLDPVEYDTELYQINKTIYEDEKFRIDMRSAVITPLDGVFNLFYTVKMDKSEYSKDESVFISFDINDGEKDYLLRQNGDWSRKEGSNAYVITESPYFSESKELFIDGICINYFKNVEDKLVIDLKEGTVCDEYKDKIEILNIERKDNNVYVVTLSENQNYWYSDFDNQRMLKYTTGMENGIKRLEFIDNDDIGTANLKVMINKTIKKEDINFKIK